MAVGKGSLARAAKVAVKNAVDGKENASEAKKETVKKEAAAKTTTKKETAAKTTAKKEAVAKEVAKTPTAKKTTAKKEAVAKEVAKTPTAKKTVAKKSVVAAPKKEVMDSIVYQPSQGILERDAAVNERFGIGDAMPIYFL